FDCHLTCEDEVERRRGFPLLHERLAVLEMADRAEADEEHERALIEGREVRARAESLQDLRLVQLVGRDRLTIVSVERRRSLRRRARRRWRVGWALASE